MTQGTKKLAARPIRLAPRSSLPCNRYPLLCLSLFLFMLPPATGAVILLGGLLAELIPRPGLLDIVVAGPFLIASFVLGMLFGATVWLLVFKRFTQREVLSEFFLAGPRVPVFSAVCSGIFRTAYPDRDEPPQPPAS